MKAAEDEGFEKRFKLSTTLSTNNMVCFDLHGKIKKYTSPEEILTDYYPKRLEYYGLRKVRTMKMGSRPGVLTMAATSCR